MLRFCAHLRKHMMARHLQKIVDFRMSVAYAICIMKAVTHSDNLENVKTLASEVDQGPMLNFLVGYLGGIIKYVDKVTKQDIIDAVRTAERKYRKT